MKISRHGTLCRKIRSGQLHSFSKLLSQPAAPVRILKLKGLHPDKLYRRYDNGEIYSGDELMYCGISIPLKKEDFRGEMYCFEEIEKGEENGH